MQGAVHAQSIILGVSKGVRDAWNLSGIVSAFDVDTLGRSDASLNRFLGKNSMVFYGVRSEANRRRDGVTQLQTGFRHLFW